MFSPGVKVVAEAPLPPTQAIDSELVLTRFASTKIDLGDELQSGTEVSSSLLLRNNSADSVEVSFRANRQAAKLLQLPESLHVDASSEQSVCIRFTPNSLGTQRVQFEVVTSNAGRLQVQLFASVVSLCATAAVTLNCRPVLRRPKRPKRPQLRYVTYAQLQYLVIGSPEYPSLCASTLRCSICLRVTHL